MNDNDGIVSPAWLSLLFYQQQIQLITVLNEVAVSFQKSKLCAEEAERQQKYAKDQYWVQLQIHERLINGH